MNKITVTNSCNANNTFGKRFELSLYSNCTIFDLRNIVGVLTNVPAEMIKITRVGTKSEIKEVQNGQTLADLEFKNNEDLIATKKNLDNIEKAPLTQLGGQLTPEARAIFEDWFDTFSKDGLMRKEDTVAFIRSCTDDNCSLNDPRVTGLFRDYDNDNDGCVTKEEFVEFYRVSSVKKPDVVRSNIISHNYTNDL